MGGRAISAGAVDEGATKAPEVETRPLSEGEHAPTARHAKQNHARRFTIWFHRTLWRARERLDEPVPEFDRLVESLDADPLILSMRAHVVRIFGKRGQRIRGNAGAPREQPVSGARLHDGGSGQ